MRNPKPCPECGSSAAVCVTTRDAQRKWEAFVHCMNCAAQGDRAVAAQEDDACALAVAKWNLWLKGALGKEDD